MILGRLVYKYATFFTCNLQFNVMSKRAVGQRGGLTPSKKSKQNAKLSGDQKLGYVGPASSAVPDKLSEEEFVESKSGDASPLIKDAKKNVPRLHKLVKGKKETKPKVSVGATGAKLRPKTPSKGPVKLTKIKKIAKPKPISKPTVLPGATNAEKYGFEYLLTPLKPASDKKEYKVIRLANGLRAILISDILGQQCAVESSEDESESDSEAESVSGTDGEESGGEESGGESGGASGGESWTDADSSDADSEMETSDASDGRVAAEGDDASDERGKPRTEVKMAAVGLTVGVGSFSDPENIPGLAHFLEHMVFMGSTKYPKENHFDSFIQRQGGSDNAHTDCETTTFYFECQERNLRRGMDKFAQFFTSPLMKKEAMTREREAVEAEFQESLSSDDDRCVQLLAGLARPHHPATKFTWGNAASLAAPRLHPALHAFRRRHYSAHRMTLAVQARLPMAELERFVASTFSSVPNNKQPPDDFSAFRDSFSTSAFCRLYRVCSVRDDLRLNLTWAMPPCIHLYRSKPYAYLEHLLDHEGDGSLSQHLRDQLLALHVSVSHSSSGFDSNSMYFLFTLEIKLTKKGYENIEQIITAVFAYLAMLRASEPSRPLFDEMQAMSEANFHYSDEAEAADYVEDLSESLQYYPPEDVIAASHLLYEFSPEMIKEFLAALTPDAVNIIVESQNASVAYDQSEQWFKTKYNVTDVPPDWLSAWRSAAPLPSYLLPAANEYLPTDFSLLPPAADELDEAHPVNVDATSAGEVWYKRDRKFGLPVAYYCCYLVSPELQLSPTNAVLLDVYAALLEFHLARELYPARAAAITYNVVAANNGLTVRVGGYSQKLLIVWEAIFKKMAAFTDNFVQKEFDAIVSNKRMAYFNTFLKPSKLNNDLRLKLLVSHHWTAAEKHAAIVDGVDGAMLAAFVERYNARLYAQCLAQGNVTRADALAARDAVFRHLRAGPIPVDVYPQYRTRRMELGERVLRVRSFNSSDPNSVLTNYYQSGPGSVRDSCLVELVMALMEEPLFDALRTKQQLGYSVRCELRDTHATLGYTVSVHYQESKRAAGEVDARVEAFLRGWREKLRAAPRDRMDRARDTLVKLKRCADVHLREEVGRNWSEILSNEYVFDRCEKEISALAGISLEDLHRWVDEHLACGTREKFRKLSIQVVGNADVGGKNPEEGPEQTLPSDGSQSPDALEELPNKKFPLQLVTESDPSFVQDISVYQQELFVYPFHQILK